MLYLIAGVLLGSSFGIHLWLERRQFSRMSGGGVQQYDSYLDLWKSRILETFAKLVFAILLVTGIVAMYAAVLIPLE